MTILSLPCQAPWETVKRVFSLYWHMMPRALERVNSSLRQCDYMPPTQVMRVTLLSLYIHASFKWFRKELDKNLLLTAGRGKMFDFHISWCVSHTTRSYVFPLPTVYFFHFKFASGTAVDPRKCRAEFEVVWLCSFQIGYFNKKLLSVFPLEWQMSNLWGGRRGSRTHIDTPAAT